MCLVQVWPPDAATIRWIPPRNFVAFGVVPAVSPDVRETNYGPEGLSSIHACSVPKAFVTHGMHLSGFVEQWLGSPATRRGWEVGLWRPPDMKCRAPQLFGVEFHGPMEATCPYVVPCFFCQRISLPLEAVHIHHRERKQTDHRQEEKRSLGFSSPDGFDSAAEAGYQR